MPAPTDESVAKESDLAWLSQVETDAATRSSLSATVSTLVDIRYGFRLLGRAPAVALISILTTAVGVGAASVVYAAAKAVLIEPFPYFHPEALAQINRRSRSGQRGLPGDDGRPASSGPLFPRRRSDSARQVAIINDLAAGLLWPGEKAVGRRICINCKHDEPPHWKQVIGVVSSIRHAALDQVPGASHEKSISYGKKRDTVSQIEAGLPFFQRTVSIESPDATAR